MVRTVSRFFHFSRFFHNKFEMPNALVVLPPGGEEMEFVGSVDVLRRAGVR